MIKVSTIFPPLGTNNDNRLGRALQIRNGSKPPLPWPADSIFFLLLYKGFSVNGVSRTHMMISCITDSSFCSTFPSAQLLLLLSDDSPLSFISCRATSISDSEKPNPFWVLLVLHANADFAIICPLRDTEIWYHALRLYVKTKLKCQGRLAVAIFFLFLAG
jgi:hypothetical protein